MAFQIRARSAACIAHQVWQRAEDSWSSGSSSGCTESSLTTAEAQTEAPAAPVGLDRPTHAAGCVPPARASRVPVMPLTWQRHWASLAAGCTVPIRAQPPRKVSLLKRYFIRITAHREQCSQGKCRGWLALVHGLPARRWELPTVPRCLCPTNPGPGRGVKTLRTLWGLVPRAAHTGKRSNRNRGSLACHGAMPRAQEPE